MIVLTGANGQLGRLIAERLLAARPAEEIALSVRDPQKAEPFAARGVRVRRGDYEDAPSLGEAFEGADTLLLISSNTLGEATIRNHRHAIAAAQTAGVRRIVYTSHMGADPASAFPPMPGHTATEAMLESSGLEWTALRNGFYADSGLMLLGPALETGEVVAPEDGPVSWTTHGDLADAAVLALTDEAASSGPTPPLTATETFDLSGIAALASGLSDRPIRRVTVGEEEFRARLAARGLPEERIGMILGLYAASRAGEFAATDPELGRLLGRSPTTMRDFLAGRLAG